MAKINASRVLLGGLLAGIVINLFEFVSNAVIFKDDIAAAMAALNKTMDMSGGTMAIYVCWAFLIGIVAVWLYAAIRPRFGAGVVTAVKAGLVMWVLVAVQTTISFAPMGLFPRRLMAIGLVISLVELVLATVLGAWLYKEEAAT
jgi:uncharacterized membrane protein